MTFDEWAKAVAPPISEQTIARQVWQAATNAERQRILSIIDAVGVQGNSDQWFEACDKIREAING